MNTAILT